LGSQEFLSANLGKKVYCACIGKIDYPGGYPRFVLSRAAVWASK